MADVTQTGEFSANDLTINYVIAENVEYAGNNGISSHKNVMRKIVNSQGETFSISLNETKKLSSTINYNTAWNSGNLKVIVYVQEKSTKMVLQSSSIPYSSLMITDVEVETDLPNKFSLEQNYPNPFNPTTTIRYTLPNIIQDMNVKMRVYNVLGKTVKTLVNEQQNSGTYRITFDASSLSNGVYYYQLTAGDFTQTRKMILLK
jgi:flagellar hook assembly protein FlgD